jgi:uncharacterized membrane protein
LTPITENDTYSLGAMLLGLACLGFYIDTRPMGRKTSGVIWVLGGAMFLSNFNIVPFEAPAYDFVGGKLVPLAIPLLLFKADIRRIFRESGRVMLTFLAASAATLIGALVGFFLLNLGDIGPKVAGVYTGAYIGGAVNLVAVSQAVEMTDTEFSSAISAGSVVSIIALMMLVALPSIQWLVRKVPFDLSSISRFLELTCSYYGVRDGLRDSWSRRYKNLIFHWIDTERVDYMSAGEMLKEKFCHARRPQTKEQWRNS